MKQRDKQIRSQWQTLTECLALAWLLWATFPPTALALDPAKGIYQYNCQTWTAQSGLDASGVNAIAQTKDAFIWLGTQKGLVRYDGVEFKAMPLPQNQLFRQRGISSLSASSDGDLWFGIANGSVGIYRPDIGFVMLTNQPWATPRMRVTDLLAASDGSVWISAGESTVRWSSKSNASQTFDFAQVDCGAMFEDSKRRVWLSMQGLGVFYYDGLRMNRFPDPTLTNTQAMVFGIAEDREGQFWLATSVDVRVYDSDFHPQPRPAIYSRARCMLADREGVVWVGTDGDGLFRCRRGELANFRKANGLVDDHVTALYEDREGNLWVGTRGGLNLLSDVKFPLYSPDGEQRIAAFHSVCASAHGGIWAGSSIGLFRFDGAQFTHYITNTWLKQVFESSDGDVYLATGNQEVEIFRDGMIVARHKCPAWQAGFAEDKQGVVVACGGQLYRVNRNGLTPYAFTNETPDCYWIRSINAARDGTILVASVNGIYRVKDGSFNRLSQENGLPVDEALWVCEDSSGVLWAGLAGGIARIEGDHVDSWTQENGVFDSYILAIIPDEHGWLWFYSNGGIFRVRRDSFTVAGRKAERLDCEAFDGPDSVKTLETADVEFSSCKTRDGRIWMPSTLGVILIDPARLPPKPALPLVHIEKIHINGKEWSRAGDTAVAPGRGELEIGYTAPTFVAPRSQHFRYKLEGYESNWELVGTRRSAFFANLKPGKYTFLVQACSSDGNTGGVADRFEVELLPFFYQTKWFYIACAGLSLVVLLGVYRWRISFLTRKQRQLQATQERLETEVKHRTVELRERTVLLEKEIEERTRMEQEVERTHRRLLAASRWAGMAEVATGVLHNVGNALNSINISTTLLLDRVRKSKVTDIRRVVQMLQEHRSDLGSFLISDSKGQQLPAYLDLLSNHLTRERDAELEELADLHKHVDHITKIVAAQQSYAEVAGVTTIENVIEIVEDAVRMNDAALEKHHVSLVRQYQEPLPKITVDRHKVLQILLNLISNAKYACDDSGRDDKEITICARCEGQRIAISVSDNGIGIPAENLEHIFNQGFTTRKNGHGFGLHNGVLAAKEMGGGLRAVSKGPGKGAEFVLELPINPPVARN